jgi:phytoene synthase
MFELAAAILGDASEAAKAGARHAGLAYGLTQRLRTFPLQASRRRLLLPPSYFESRGTDLEWVYTGRQSAALAAALADFRDEAARELQQFRELRAKLDRAAWPAFLPLALVEPYLKAMAARSFEPLQTVVTLNPLRQYWRIWRAALLRAV